MYHNSTGKWSRRGTLVPLLLAGLVSCSGSDTSEEGTLSAELNISPSEDLKNLYAGNLALARLRSLTDLGPRVTGGAAEDAAAASIAAYWKGLGLQVTSETFPTVYFLRNGASFQLEGSPLPAIEPLIAFFSPSGTFTLPIVDCGLGFPEDCAPRSEPFIALLERGIIYYWQKAVFAAEDNAVAIVVSNHSPGPAHQASADFPDIPIVTISQSDGAALREAMKAFASPIATLTVDTVRDVRESQNIIATRPGTAPQAGTLYIGAHYDSVQVGVGANDNASGMAAIMEASRVLSKGHQTKANLRFIAFGGEEWGDYGSWDYVERHQEELAKSGLGMLNADMVGVGEILMVGNTDAPPDLVDYTVAKAAAMKVDVERFTSPPNSDHTPFEALGLPTVVFHGMMEDGTEDPFYHTSQDLCVNLNPSLLERTGELMTAVAYDWAKNPVLRARRARAVATPLCAGCEEK